MQNSFQTTVLKTHSRLKARMTRIITPHGEVITPAFMPVATRAYVNHLLPEDLLREGSQIILGGNTYHMLCAPGMKIIEKMGGMHHFMNWHRPMLTDSGGFQVFSLSKNKEICKINENGARFKHPVTGKIIELTPAISIATQKIIGADIIMAFDECTPEEGGREAAEQAMARTHRWLLASKEMHEQNPQTPYGYAQALFGIIQGGRFRDLREASTQFILNLDLDGIAIGGESIGFDMNLTQEILEWVVPLLPDHKTRYTMGIGLNPQDLIDVVAKGVDIFDCVAPTRNARHGTLYHGHVVPDGDWVRFEPGLDEDEGKDKVHEISSSALSSSPNPNKKNKGRITITKGRYAEDERPILQGCKCYTCQHYTRAYMHYLAKTKLPLYSHLACIHNIHVMHQVCVEMRKVIMEF